MLNQSWSPFFLKKAFKVQMGMLLQEVTITFLLACVKSLICLAFVALFAESLMTLLLHVVLSLLFLAFKVCKMPCVLHSVGSFCTWDMNGVSRNRPPGSSSSGRIALQTEVKMCGGGSGGIQMPSFFFCACNFRLMLH